MGVHLAKRLAPIKKIDQRSTYSTASWTTIQIYIGEAPVWGAYEASEASRELPAGQEMTREAGLLFLYTISM